MNRVDIVDNQVQIPLRQIFKTGVFGQYFPQLCVDIFNAALLAAPHGAQ